MRNTILPALLLSSLTLALSCDSCDKDDNNTNLPTFTGISLADANGMPLGTADLTDWHVNDTWGLVEKDLFDQSELPFCTGDGVVAPAYPNPCGSVLNFRFVSAANSAAYFRVVDKDFNVLVEADSIPCEAGAKTISLNFSTVNPDTVRLYYRIVGSTCEYRGHGDVLVQ